MARALSDSDCPACVLALIKPMEPQRPRLILPPLPIDLALNGATVADSARLRERYVMPFVVDAMVLIEDALHRTAGLAPSVGRSASEIGLWSKPSALSQVMALHAGRVYGKPDLLAEVVRHMPNAAAKSKRDPGPALELIRTEYAPRMRLVDPSGISLPDEENRLASVAAIDPDDEPTARLSRLLDPSIVLTRDRKALLRFGFGQWVEDPEMDAFAKVTKDDWLKATLRIRNRAFGAQVEVGGRVIMVSGRLAVSGVRKAIGIALANEIPVALLLGGLIVLLWTSRGAPFWHDLGKNITAMTASTLSDVGRRTRGRPEAAASAGLMLDAYVALHTSPDLPVAQVARALAIGPPKGLTIQDLRQITGHRFAVRPIVDAHPAFVEDDHRRWHLGQSARMPA